MRQRITEREPEVRLTDTQIDQLPEGYALLALWSRHVPMDELVMLREGDTSFYIDNDDGTATILEHNPLNRQVVVPIRLAWRTVEYKKRMHLYGRRDPLFRDDMNEPISVAGFIDFVLRHAD